MPSFADLTRMIKRGLDVPADTAQRISRNVVPTLEVGSVARWWENDSRTERPCWGWATKAAVASNISHIALVNPAANAGVGCLITQLSWFFGAGGYLEILTTTEADVLALATVVETATLKAFRDTRQIAIDGTAADRPSCKLYTGHHLALINGDRGHRVRGINEPIDRKTEIFLEAGTALVFGGVAANTEIAQVSFEWSELKLPR